MVRPFSRSKRTPVRLRHKIEKASAAKQRKQRKEAKKSPQWKSRLKKDPGIPNLFPFKAQMLAEIEERKRYKAEEIAKARELARGKKAVVDEVEATDGAMELSNAEEGGVFDEMVEDNNPSNPLAALLASAQARATEYHEEEDDDVNSEMNEDREGLGMASKISGVSVDYKNTESSRRAFDKIFKQVVDAADVVLEVLDARDPEGTRSQEIERQIMASQNGSKRLIIILNKTDLVPPSVLKAWLTHLRRSFPTIPLRASTAASKAQTFDHKKLTVRGTSEALLRALKSYAASKQMKRSLTVGVVGYPNVGKSSVINALTSQLNKGRNSSACPVGSEAGITTSLREVKVDNKLKVLDSPGIVFPSVRSREPRGSAHCEQADEEARLVLLNALPFKQISDPVSAVSLLISRLSSSSSLSEKLLQTYNIKAVGPFRNGDTTTDFLIQVARQRGRIGKGGVPNINAAAMAVITDWRDGRIQGWVDAPTLQVASADEELDEGKPEIEGGSDRDRIDIVKEWAEEFKLEGLWGDEPRDENAMQQE